MTELSKYREELAEALATHGIYGFNGSEVACRCSQRKWRYLLDWHAHVADALLPVLARVVAEAKAEAWDEGWGARAKYLGTDGDHYRGRNPYRAEASGREGEHG